MIPKLWQPVQWHAFASTAGSDIAQYGIKSGTVIGWFWYDAIKPVHRMVVEIEGLANIDFSRAGGAVSEHDLHLLNRRTAAARQPGSGPAQVMG